MKEKVKLMSENLLLGQISARKAKGFVSDKRKKEYDEYLDILERELLRRQENERNK